MPNTKQMDFKKILELIKQAGKESKTLEIYYPRTESFKKGWREIEPYSISTDIGREGEHLSPDKEEIRPGHILNAFTVASKDDHCGSFILGKIKSAKIKKKKFVPRNGWKVEF